MEKGTQEYCNTGINVHLTGGRGGGRDFCLIKFTRIPVQGSAGAILVTSWWRVPHLTDGALLLG
jgi:hypothetical protein